MSTTPLIPNSSQRLPNAVKKSELQELLGLVHINLDLSTTLLIGASIQSLLVLTLPPLYALTPALFLLAVIVINNVLMVKGWKPNPIMKNVILGKFTGQVLDSNGVFPGAGKEKVAVLLLSVKTNHPLGLFGYGLKEISDYQDGFIKELEAGDQTDSGFLGVTGFTRNDGHGGIQVLSISYWRSVAHVHKFAHGDSHIKAWQWWNKELSNLNHAGIMHEVFEAPAGMWESIYVNFQPTMLSATTYLKKDGKLQGGALDEKWVSGILDANRGPFRTSMGRRGQTHQGYKEASLDMHDENIYDEVEAKVVA